MRRGLTVREAVAAMQVDPPLPFQTLIERATRGGDEVALEEAPEEPLG